MKVRKMLIFAKSKFDKTQWAWQGVKLSRLSSIFTSKNVWNFFIKIQLTKSNPKIIRGVNSPCLMTIRVNGLAQEVYEVLLPYEPQRPLDQAREAYLVWGSFLKFGFYGTFDFITQANLPFRNGANLTFNVPSYPNQIFVEGELIIT